MIYCKLDMPVCLKIHP
uniref:Uncharacterized protein n=1 Tax=Anguilla anguilla TaxID=7936 RepID=A0A0E9SLS8_ANGAN